MRKRVIIIGAGGHGKVIADIVLAAGDEVGGFLDDGKAPGEMVCGIPVLGPVADYEKYVDAWFVAGVGNAAIRESSQVAP